MEGSHQVVGGDTIGPDRLSLLLLSPLSPISGWLGSWTGEADLTTASAPSVQAVQMQPNNWSLDKTKLRHASCPSSPGASG